MIPPAMIMPIFHIVIAEITGDIPQNLPYILRERCLDVILRDHKKMVYTRHTAIWVTDRIKKIVDTICLDWHDMTKELNRYGSPQGLRWIPPKINVTIIR